MNLAESIKQHEGFKPKPYPDPIHGWKVPTFGYGFTSIDEEEANYLLNRRIAKTKARLNNAKGFFVQLPETVQDVLVEMAYQMGVNGVLRFKKMWQAIAARDYEKAADEMLDSRWAKQTPKRAHELAEKMKQA